MKSNMNTYEITTNCQYLYTGYDNNEKTQNKRINMRINNRI